MEDVIITAGTHPGLNRQYINVTSYSVYEWCSYSTSIDNKNVYMRKDELMLNNIACILLAVF